MQVASERRDMAGSPLRTHMDLPPLSSSREQRHLPSSIGQPVNNR